ncbi:hypothetical protein KO02_12540 [Sphingobacterium sp. ML3W]|uniref:helix-turn-helix domain-containing protein n=1 Tax=Sphingobacterium sp. ML3W TaxID=1538644 RepID=UPI0004F8C46C|nr:helix-turn-helix transcriptional regulator [Sphingobacterium sp. ML3W]AIM37422.1 hypothetical protein KO02_12540 [Sphingobacterium sp. ML3W]
MNLNKANIFKEIGSRLRKAREMKDMTATEVAAKIGLQKTAFSHFENGTNMPKLWIFLQLCAIYEVNPSYILCLDDTSTISKQKIEKLFKI